MDKIIRMFFLCSFLLLASGCGTIKGAYQGAIKGAEEDWDTAKEADDWMQKNLW